MNNKILKKWIVFRIIIRDWLNPYLGPIRRRLAGLGEGNSLTIISNNCWGGHVYRYFDMPYTSPTVGLFFFTEEYLKFVSNLKHYLSLDIRFIPIEESRYRNVLIERNTPNCPIGVLDDVEIVFLHYRSEEDAYQKWSRRKERMNFSRIIVKMSEQNLCAPEHLKMFDSLPYQEKFVFVHKDYGLESQIICNEFASTKEVGNDTDYFRRHVNLIKLVKGENYKR